MEGGDRYMSSELNVLEEQLKDSVRVSISGEVDIYTSQNLKDRLYGIADSTRMDIRIDCRNLNYIDSTGLGIFVGTLKKVKQYGKDIYIENLKDNIRKLFLITGLDKLFIIE
jgi:anti-sigma B factor antagonist